jgi:hypothetical protein
VWAEMQHAQRHRHVLPLRGEFLLRRTV